MDYYTHGGLAVESFRHSISYLLSGLGQSIQFFLQFGDLLQKVSRYICKEMQWHYLTLPQNLQEKLMYQYIVLL